MTQATIGDFGGTGRQTKVGDDRLDIQAAAEEATAGCWEYWVHTPKQIAWLPEGDAHRRMLRVKYDEKRDRWVVERRYQKGTADYLKAAIEQASEYMSEHRDG